MVAVATLDRKTGELVGEPEIVSRGFLSEPGHELAEEIRAAVVKAVEVAAGQGTRNQDAMRRVIRRTVGRLVNERTRMRPMIVAVIVEA